MKKKIALGVSAALLSGAAFANSGSNQIDMDGDIDTIQVQQDSGASQRRTNFFTGLVYNESVSEYAPKRKSYRFVYLDGSTRINENFRFRHVLSESWLKESPDHTTQHGRVNFTLAPRYEQWVSPSFSWFAEPVLIRQTEAQGNTNYELKLKPGAQFTFGNHFISATGDYQFKWRERYNSTASANGNRDNDRWNAYSFDINYVNRYSRTVNFGISGTYAGTPDNSDYDNRRRNYNVKPFVRVRHFHDITTELNMLIGHEESGRYWNGYDYWAINFNNNKRLTRNIRGVANVQYRDNTRDFKDGPQDYSNGDRQELQFRVGLNITI
ncbi:hypothetical protein [Thaumasiovibrio subtropicus]|uniref:hypothetical protein n=1 Tax=Thaumasiovibrio subtropicus TaxID=1891207 RepID=UPI000B353183|nr:hypothetical protein [Thaumasiovibrio subtropicus]